MPGFWKELKKPFLGLSPMDGVTDAPFRSMVANYGKPDLIFTEFVSVEGIAHGNVKGLNAFIYNRIERPIVAQIFGNTPNNFYQAAILLCHLEFDGIDINMGCPAKNVSSKGSGAALIQTPELAQQIILHAKKATEDYANGQTMQKAGLPAEIIDWANKRKKNTKPKHIPVSVKTRIGFNKPVIEDWIPALLETKPVAISLHGRTLKQMYTGSANWDEIKKAAQIIKKTKTLVLGNGDVQNKTQALQYAKKYNVDGVLIGRAAFGNPFVFTDNQSLDLKTRSNLALKHARLFEKLLPENHFVQMRKHLAWYIKGFEKASETRQKLMQTNNADDVEKILSEIAI
ncbi:hypothetical protein GF340_02165 [Candidatus Peregrinibacteria bacterium]|nr:hypothetical protein [Candidatus Peregrinibacteria bacterium]